MALAKVKKVLRAFLGDAYRPEAYWRTQLGAFGESMRGPGNGRLSEEENLRLYRHGESALAELTSRLGVSWSGRFAEIGPGNGYWLEWLHKRGVRSYTAYDVTEVLFGLLRKQRPEIRLIKHDVTRGPLKDSFDVILMIDVTQHIVRESSFSAAMTHCGEALRPGGHFIVTSWLQPYQRFSEAEMFRPLDAYTDEFPGWKLTGPLPFRDKFILGFTKNDVERDLRAGVVT